MKKDGTREEIKKWHRPAREHEMTASKYFDTEWKLIRQLVMGKKCSWNAAPVKISDRMHTSSHLQLRAHQIRMAIWYRYQLKSLSVVTCKLISNILADNLGFGVFKSWFSKATFLPGGIIDRNIPMNSSIRPFSSIYLIQWEKSSSGSWLGCMECTPVFMGQEVELLSTGYPSIRQLTRQTI